MTSKAESHARKIIYDMQTKFSDLDNGLDPVSKREFRMWVKARFSDFSLSNPQELKVCIAKLEEMVGQLIEEPTATIVCQDDKMPKMARAAMAAVLLKAKDPDAPAADQLFQRGGALVHVSRNRIKKPRKDKPNVDMAYRVENQLRVDQASDGFLGDLFERSIKFMKPGRKAGGQSKAPPPVPCGCPAKLVTRVQSIKQDWRFPHLLGTVEAPTLRRDGSLLDEPGYDVKSGLYYDDNGVEFPEVPNKPNRKQAESALTLLEDVLVDFPWRDDDGVTGLSKSVALAAMLTAPVRRSLKIAPMFGFDADEVASGKTELAQIPAIIMTGRKTGERPFPTDGYQLTTALSAALDGGDDVLLWDNVDVPIEGAALCGALTEETMTTRRLGSNTGTDEIVAPTNALQLATGNKLAFAGDMTDRALVCRIVPEKKFADRDAYKHDPLDDYVIANRPALVAACLTILRAYIAAGQPQRTEKRRCRFGAWQYLIADSLVWLGQTDPCLAFERAKAGDPTRDYMLTVMAAWVKEIGAEPATTAMAIAWPMVRDAIATACDVAVADRLTVRKAADYLTTMVGVSLHGYRLVKSKDRHGTAEWLAKPGADAVTFADESFGGLDAFLAEGEPEFPDDVEDEISDADLGLD